MKNKKVILQPSEWIIMEKLWEKKPQTIMQLFHALKEEQGWSKSTVNTMLSRMTGKNIISYEEGVKAKQYYPLVSRDEAAIVETENLVDRIYKGSVSMMMSTLIKSSNISKKEIEELYRILEEAAQEKDD